MYADTPETPRPVQQEWIPEPIPSLAIQSLSVDIYDQVYRLRGVDPEHIQKLASLVDGKMRAVSAHGSTVDSLRVAVLAALNIADELNELRQRHADLINSLDKTQTSMRSRAGSLNGLLDEVLLDRIAV